MITVRLGTLVDSTKALNEIAVSYMSRQNAATWLLILDAIQGELIKNHPISKHLDEEVTLDVNKISLDVFPERITPAMLVSLIYLLKEDGNDTTSMAT